MVLLFVSANFPSLLFKECATQKAANHVAHVFILVQNTGFDSGC